MGSQPCGRPPCPAAWCRSDSVRAVARVESRSRFGLPGEGCPTHDASRRCRVERMIPFPSLPAWQARSGDRSPTIAGHRQPCRKRSDVVRCDRTTLRFLDPIRRSGRGSPSSAGFRREKDDSESRPVASLCRDSSRRRLSCLEPRFRCRRPVRNGSTRHSTTWNPPGHANGMGEFLTTRSDSPAGEWCGSHAASDMLGGTPDRHLPVRFRPRVERDRLAFQPTRRPVSRRLLYVSLRNNVVPHAKRFASRREASRRPRVVAGLLDWRAAFAIERRSVRSESSCDPCARSCDRPATSRSVSRSLAQGFSSLDCSGQCPEPCSPPSRSNSPVATGDALMERPCLSGVSYRTVPRCDSLRGSSTFTTIRFV